MAITHKKIEPAFNTGSIFRKLLKFFIICQNGMLRPKFIEAFEVNGMY